jgi:hypothetical protein
MEKARECTAFFSRRRKRPEQGDLAIVCAVELRLRAGIDLLPAIGQFVIVRIDPIRDEGERGVSRDLAIYACVHGRWTVLIGNPGPALSQSPAGVLKDLIQAGDMKIGIGVFLEVVVPTDACISLDRRPTSRLERRCLVPEVPATLERSIERMIGIELMPHLMGDVVDIERIADGVDGTSHALAFPSRLAGHAKLRQPPGARAERMPEIIVTISDDPISVEGDGPAVRFSAIKPAKVEDVRRP